MVKPSLGYSNSITNAFGDTDSEPEEDGDDEENADIDDRREDEAEECKTRARPTDTVAGQKRRALSKPQHINGANATNPGVVVGFGLLLSLIHI